MNPESIPHIRAAARNQAIAQTILQRSHPGIDPPPDDWIITILFYSALHLVDAYTLTARNEKARTHHVRNRLVRSDPVLSTIAGEYLLLGELSRTARYAPLANFPENQLQQAFDQFEVIRRTVANELGPA